jgi:hypothetical protein
MLSHQQQSPICPTDLQTLLCAWQEIHHHYQTKTNNELSPAPQVHSLALRALTSLPLTRHVTSFWYARESGASGHEPAVN